MVHSKGANVCFLLGFSFSRLDKLCAIDVVLRVAAPRPVPLLASSFDTRAPDPLTSPFAALLDSAPDRAAQEREHTLALSAGPVRIQLEHQAVKRTYGRVRRVWEAYGFIVPDGICI